tara:strand:+ start:5160 stop:5573 length:414 start_codon:yes stop_codon:yes gene_type:complete
MEYNMQLYCNDKGQWSGTQSDAKKIKRENDGLSFESINVPTDKKGLLEFLNKQSFGSGDSTNASQVAIDPVIIRSGSVKSTPLAYVKDDVGITEIDNVYDNLRDAYVSMQHIMDKLGHVADQTSLLKDECFKEVSDE